MLIFTFIKDYQNEQDIVNIQKEDSIRFANAQTNHKEELKNTAKDLQDEFTKSLAQYGLEYKRLHDSSGKIIEKLVKDSTKQTIIEEASPNFGLSIPALITKRYGDSMRYDLNFLNQGAPSRVQKINIYFTILNSTNQYQYLGKQEFIKNERSFFKDFEFSYGGFVKDSKITQAKWIYFYLKGKYTDAKRKHIYEMNELYGARLGDSTIGSYMSEPFRGEIIELIKSHESIEQ